MPIYSYTCRSCKGEHEAIRKFSDPPLKKCPSCGGRLKKNITSTAFHLKGGGWYKDGYTSPKPEKKEESKPVEKKKEEKKSEPKKADIKS